MHFGTPGARLQGLQFRTPVPYVQTVPCWCTGIRLDPADDTVVLGGAARYGGYRGRLPRLAIEDGGADRAVGGDCGGWCVREAGPLQVPLS